jgi:hypothetical protein
MYTMQVLNVLPNLGVAAAPVRREASAVEKAALSITAQNAVGRKKGYGRNDRVVITDGKEKREVKYKKAEALLSSGEWRIVEN